MRHLTSLSGTVSAAFRRVMTVRVPVVAVVALSVLAILVLYSNQLTNVREFGRDQPSGLGIKELIQNVKLELQETERQAREQNQSALFLLKDFDLEVKFVLQARSKGTAGVDYELVAIGSEMELGTERIHTIRLHMEAIQRAEGFTTASQTVMPARPEGTVTHGRPPPPKEGDQ